MVQEMKSVQNLLKIAYENDAAASFLVVQCDAETIEYQSLMLGKNTIPCVIPLNILEKDGDKFFYYNITSKVSLAFYLDRRKLGIGELLKLLLDITTAFADASGYLLTDSGFLLESGYVFINPETLEPALVYLPVREEIGGPTLRAFISDLVLEHINEKSYGDGYIVQRLLAAARSEAFSIGGFSALLCELLYGREEEKYEEEPKDESPLPDNPEHRVYYEKEEKAMKAPEIEKTSEKNRLGLIIFISAQGVMGLILFLCRNFITGSGGDPMPGWLAAAMIILAVDVLLYKKLLMPGSENNTVEAVDNPPVEAKEHNQSEKALSSNLHHETPDPVSDVRPLDPQFPDTISLNLLSPEENTGKAGSKTELLVCRKGDRHALKSTGRQDGPEIIQIDKDDFIIGRLEGCVDCALKNNAVGKLHAQIIKREGVCYIKDLNTINGTYLNNIRIESNKEYELKENDILQLANSEFLFSCCN